MYKDSRRFKKLIKLAIIPSALCLSWGALAENKPIKPAQLTPCYVKGFTDRMMCGKVSRPLSDDAKDGNIDIHFSVIPAVKDSYPKEAVMAFAGGPGQSAIELAGNFERSLRFAREKRAIILVDQRGTGKSNKQHCDSDDLTSQYAFNDHIVDFEQYTISEVKKCQEKFTADLSYFTTSYAAKDFEAVRQALGYEGLHLYGGSYGTRIAQEYTRQFPSSVLTSTLDGVVPMQQSLVAIGNAIDDSFNTLFERCDKDTACNKTYPNLKGKFEQLLNQLETQPLELKINHPRTFEQIDFVITKMKFYGAIRMALYSHTMRSIVPLVISQTLAGNYAPLSGLLSSTDLASGLAMGMHNAIVCGEDWPVLSEDSRALYSKSYFGKAMLEGLDVMCPLLNVKPVNKSFYEPLNNNIPTLLLSGQRDPATPPSWAELAMVKMNNATHLVSPTATHIVASQTCASKILADFIDARTMESIDTACLNEPNDKHFFMNINGVAQPKSSIDSANNKE